MNRFAVAVAIAVLVGGCSTKMEGLGVQSSSEGDPGGRIVRVTEEGTFGPSCLVIEAGQTVEFRNMSPDVPTNITSLGSPAELYSPNMATPYNSAEEDDVSGEAKRYSYWRHTFGAPGVYEYYNTNTGDPGRKVVDPYYGTVTFVGISDSVKTGVICVETPGGNQCDGVCCVKVTGDCPSSQCCDLKNKRCVLFSPMNPQPLCEGQKPAFREFGCFLDSDCEAGTCGLDKHQCE